MRSWLTLAVGALIGQWLAFGGVSSPAELHALGRQADARRDYPEAARIWSRAASLQPDNATFHYLRATALARIGQRASAADAFEMALLLQPPAPLARLATQGLAQLALESATVSDAVSVVPLESARGVWVAHVLLNDVQRARFLVDTGASVTLVSPALASTLGLRADGGASAPLQTVGGLTAGTSTVLASVRLGSVEARDVPAVIHDPGLELDGILGNSFLGRFTVTLDGDHRVLHLRTLTQ